MEANYHCAYFKLTTWSQSRLRETNSLHVVVVGAGIGGLACAIACRRADPPIAVTVVERTPEILPIGAGIHVPPNGTRVLDHLGVVDRLKEAGGYVLQHFILRRYADGQIISDKPIGSRVTNAYGAEWL